MKIIRSPETWPQEAHGAVMALGNFDGVHAGHRVVIGHAKALASAQGRPLAVMTFEPHPRRFFKPGLPILRIVPLAEKARLLRDLGVDYLYIARFNATFSQLSAESFLRRLLLDKLQVAHIVTGHNFAFGHHRQGNSDYLAQYSHLWHYAYTQVEAVAAKNIVYSSSGVRQALSEGNIAMASHLLGRPYGIRGTVIHGQKRGRQLGFPTANIRPSPLFLPKAGVYAVRMTAGEQTYAGVANLGTRPTVDGHTQLLEVHVFDATPDLYGQHVSVEFASFIREEQKFDGIDALKTQIAADSLVARQLLLEKV